MALRTTLFFIILFLLVGSSAVLIDTTGEKGKKAAEVPTIEFNNFEIYNITKNGVTESLFADRGLHFEAKDILYNGFIYRGSDGNIEGVNGKEIVITPQRLVISGEGKFISTDGYEITSEKIVYDINSKKGHTVGKFLVTQDLDTLEGDNLWFDVKEKKMGASKIIAKIELNNLN